MKFFRMLQAFPCYFYFKGVKAKNNGILCTFRKNEYLCTKLKYDE